MFLFENSNSNVMNILVLTFLLQIIGAWGEHCDAQQYPIPVWIDCDPSVGEVNRDIDDGLALLQAFSSPELDIVGVSIIFGNTNILTAERIGNDITSRFSGKPIPVYKGALNRDMLGDETEASLAIRDALKQKSLVILTLGAATNVATAIKNNPDLWSQVIEVVAVAGRRPGQRFTTGSAEHSKGHIDLNFESDVEAFRVIINSGVKLVLAPFEISSKVWITAEHIRRWHEGGTASRWIADYADTWLQTWKYHFNVDGFNPYDTLAVGFVTSPQLIECEDLPIDIVTAEDDGVKDVIGHEDVPVAMKQYLVLARDLASPHTATYCHRALDGFIEDLMTRLLK